MTMVDESVDTPRDSGTEPFEAGSGPGRELDALKQERDALQDRLLRTAAEFDNFRKRIERERREMVEGAAADLLLDILPVVDDLERALQANAGADVDAYRRGVQLIHRQLLDLLKRRHVTPIDVDGKVFDPQFHQSVSQETSATHQEGAILEEFRRGYLLGDRLLRPAMVKVASRE
jgi:molecular chaperone GrpE